MGGGQTPNTYGVVWPSLFPIPAGPLRQVLWPFPFSNFLPLFQRLAQPNGPPDIGDRPLGAHLRVSCQLFLLLGPQEVLFNSQPHRVTLNYDTEGV